MRGVKSRCSTLGNLSPEARYIRMNLTIKLAAWCAVVGVALAVGHAQAQEPVKASLGEGPSGKRMECTVTVSRAENKVIEECYAGAKFRNGTRFHRFLFVIQDANGNPLWDNFGDPPTITIGAPANGSFRSKRVFKSYGVPDTVRQNAAKVRIIFQYKENTGFDVVVDAARNVLREAVEELR